MVTRFTPKWLDFSSYRLLYSLEELSPSQDLLLKYKQNNDWDWYVKEFKKEMDDMASKLDSLKYGLETGQDYCLICYEKDYTKCHRSILGEYFRDMGIEWKEL